MGNMKKLIVLVCAVVFLFGVIGFAQAHSEWAKYRNNPVPEGFTQASGHTDANDHIRCCDCHGRISNIPPVGCP